MSIQEPISRVNPERITNGIMYPDANIKNMNTCRMFLVICCLTALITFSGHVFGDEPPFMQALVSGNVSAITEPMPGTYHILIENVNPDSKIFYEKRSVLVPVPLILPVNLSTAAIDLVDDEGKEMTFMVRAANPSYSEENQTLHCELIPLEFDEDTNLVPVKERVRTITAGSYTRTNITLGYAVQPVENAPSDFCCTFVQVENQKCVPMRPLCGY